MKSRSGWVVTSTTNVIEGEAFKITRLEVHPGADRQRSVAVLDDDSGVTDSVVSSFELLGYCASPFYSAADLLAATGTFDCFVLDWVVGHTTVLELVRSVRAADPSCPIVILTAHVATGAVDEADIADAMRQYNLHFCEKPVRASIVAAMLSRAFASQPDPKHPPSCP